MSRETLVALGVALLAVLGGGYVWSVWTESAEEERRVEREERREARRGEALAQLEELRDETRALLPELLGGVALGMSLEDVRGLRHSAMSREDRRSEGDPYLSLWHERLPNGAEVMYGFDDRVDLLMQVQIMSMLPDTSAIAPHLAAMNDTYGPPTGIWNCPATGDVPTRRFTWRRAESAVSDIFLILPNGRVSVTLYVATSERTAQSLARSGCHPATPEELETFPVADHVPTPDGEGAPGGI